MHLRAFAVVVVAILEGYALAVEGDDALVRNREDTDESAKLRGRDIGQSLPGGAKANVFDLFDRDGNLVDRIALPAGSRLVGFDRQWLYTVRIDADDFEHLQRFPLPR